MSPRRSSPLPTGQPGGHLDDGLWGITSYFDPTGRKRRLSNYREFHRGLQVPLVTVELSFDGSFDLTAEDAEILIQVQGGSILWQKERLLNLALQALPSSCDTVAWLDCDLLFLRSDWPSAVRRQLDHFALVQLFERLYYVPANYRGDFQDLARLQSPYRSVVYYLSHGLLCTENFVTPGTSQRIRYNPGMAWAAKRTTLQSEGFYDALVLGGGDKAIFSAACGRFVEFTNSFQPGLSAKAHYLAWAERFHDATRGQLGYLEGDLLHLWHGELAHRGYSNRYASFAPFGFDPCSDIALNKDGVWHWSSNKPEMHDFVREHFEKVENPGASSVSPQKSSSFLSAS
jgi:hypothetical protein